MPEARGNFVRTLQENFDSLTRSRKAIARYLIDHLAEAPVLTAEELARRTNTTSSTVVRFAQHLGYSGFSAMMKAAWDEHRLSSTIDEGEDGQLHFRVVDDDFSGRSLRTDMRNLEGTMRKNRMDEFIEIVTLMEKADRIFVGGFFEAAMVVDYFYYYLSIMGLPVAALTSNSEESVAQLSTLTDQSLLIAIGFGNAHQFMPRLVRSARAAGALTAGISDNDLSEVAKLADKNLYCDMDSASFAPSLASAFSLANALVAALYSRNRKKYDAHLGRLKSLPLSSDWLV
jgi:DNA-binding MurR/RpiR family transcriptional regulator